MRWIRLKCSHVESLNYPTCCPNCLREPADTEVKVSRSYLFANIALTYSMPWLFCAACAEHFRKFGRLRLLLGWLPGIALIVWAVINGVTDTSTKSSGFSLQLLGYAIVLILIGSASAWLIQKFSKRTDGRLSNFPAVRVNRCGTKAFSQASFFDVSIADPRYADAFADTNPQLEISRS